MRLWEREQILRSRGCKPVDPQYVIVWEDPRDLDAPCVVTTPSPNWLGYAMHGNFLPPVSAFLRDRKIEQNWIKENPGESFSWDKAGGALHPYAETIGAMTEEEAMEYLVLKDLPEAVWGDDTGNRPRFRICRREMMPKSRRYRDAWRLVSDESQN